MTDKWKKKLTKIAEYLGANEGEFVIEVGKLCQEAIEEKIEKIKGMRDMKYPPLRFTKYIDENNISLEPGVQENTHVRRMTEQDKERLKIYDDIINLLEEK